MTENVGVTFAWRGRLGDVEGREPKRTFVAGNIRHGNNNWEGKEPHDEDFKEIHSCCKREASELLYSEVEGGV